MTLAPPSGSHPERVRQLALVSDSLLFSLLLLPPRIARHQLLHHILAGAIGGLRGEVGHHPVTQHRRRDGATSSGRPRRPPFRRAPWRRYGSLTTRTAPHSTTLAPALRLGSWPGLRAAAPLPRSAKGHRNPRTRPARDERFAVGPGHRAKAFGGRVTIASSSRAKDSPAEFEHERGSALWSG